MIQLLLEPFHYPFMRTGLAAAVLTGGICGLLGVYVVLRRISYIGHALTHSALPGLAWASRQGFSLFGGALISNFATALGIAWMSRRKDVHEDTAIGVFSTAMFAAGLLVMAGTKSYRDLSGMLFGQVLGVTPMDAVWMALVAFVVGGALLLFHKEWMLATLDPGHAEMIGLPVGALRLGFLMLLVLGVGVAVQTVGAVLTGALLVAPAAAARLLSRRLPQMMMLSSALGAACGAGGLWLSYYTALPSGAAIVLLCAAVYAVVHVGVGVVEFWETASPLRRALGGALVLNTLVIVVEAVGGWHARSLTLGLDVAHNLADEIGLLLLFMAHARAGEPASGLRRAGMVFHTAGLLSVLFLLAGGAVARLAHPVAVDGWITLVCGLLAVAGNGGVAWCLKAPARKDPALKLAHVHNVADALLSLVPTAAGALVLATGRSGADTLLALIGALVLIPASARALRAAWRREHVHE